MFFLTGCDRAIATSDLHRNPVSSSISRKRNTSADVHGKYMGWAPRMSLSVSNLLLAGLVLGFTSMLSEGARSQIIETPNEPRVHELPALGKPTQESHGNEVALSKPTSYRLDRGDRVRLTVYDRPDLTGDYRVSDSGQLRLPQLGALEAAGRALSEIEDEVRKKFETILGRSSYVHLEIIERRPIFVVGFVGKPGAYPFSPGIMVIQAMALAGGIYRPGTGLWPNVETSREHSKIKQAREELNRLYAVRSRLKSDRAGEAEVKPSHDLVELAGEKLAAEFAARETNILKAQRKVTARNIASLEATIINVRDEILSLESQLSALAKEQRLRASQVSTLKKLSKKGLTLTQRLTDTEIAVSLVERDSQTAIAGISRARRDLERSERDLAMINLERNTKIEEELTEIGEQIKKQWLNIKASREIIQNLTGLPASVAIFDPSAPISFEIMRRQPGGQVQLITGDETTTLAPGDVLRVTPGRWNNELNSADRQSD